MEPLANKIRPTSLDNFVGQQHLVGEGKPLRQAIEQKHLFSFLLWGPPGVGKTTLARIYAKAVEAEYFELSAVSAGKDDIRKIVMQSGSTDASRSTENYGLLKSNISEKPKILFLDEIHRFNKAQQDFLLPFVESGKLYLIGATTENPSFEVIPALLSRARVFVLNELTDKNMDRIIDQALSVIARNASDEAIPPVEIASDALAMTNEAKDWLIQMANGDARQVLTMLDACQSLYGNVTLENLKNTLQSKHLRYDKKGEEHYNTISAFIKSMRASQPDAALYYLARMIDSGEDAKFIARRMVIFASEDIGLAQPTALVVANAVFQASDTIGYPECAINLAHGVVYLSQCKKDRSAYDAYLSAMEDVKNSGNLPIPKKIVNAPTKLMKDLGYGENYEKYSTESYLPEEIKNKKYLL